MGYLTANGAVVFVVTVASVPTAHVVHEPCTASLRTGVEFDVGKLAPFEVALCFNIGAGTGTLFAHFKMSFWVNIVGATRITSQPITAPFRYPDRSGFLKS